METRAGEPSIFTPPDLAAHQETCVTCGAAIDTPYCSTCGEMRSSDRKHGIWDFIRDHVIESVISFDGRVIRSVKALLLEPGKLTREFMRGSRIPYVVPLQLFFMINVVYFLWSAKVHSPMFETQITVQVQQPVYGPIATRLVHADLIAHGDTTKETRIAYTREFNRLESTQARSLIITMAPIFTVFVAILTLGGVRRRPLVQHVVFSLHTLTFLLVFVIVGRYLVDTPLEWVLSRAHVTPGMYGYDEEYSIAMLVLIGSYLAVSLRRAYEFSWVSACLRGFVLFFGLFFSLTLYRALLFFVTFYSK
jgi:hypothetical protein